MEILNNLLAWKVLIAVSNRQGMKGASLATGLDLPTCSRLVQKLEEAVGVRLIDRSVRPVRLTAEAAPLLKKARALIDKHDELLMLVQNLSLTPMKIRIGIPVNNPRRSIYKLLQKYEKEDPTLSIEIHSDCTHLDVLEGRVDIAYLPYRPPADGLFIWDIGKIGNVPLASPGYLSKHAKPQTPADLQDHDIIIRMGPNYPVTKTLHRGKETAPLLYKTIAFAGDVASGKEAVLNGDGIALDLSIAYCLREIEDGTLVPILNGWHRPDWDKTLVVTRDALSNARLVNFARHFVKLESESSKIRCEANQRREKEWFPDR